MPRVPSQVGSTVAPSGGGIVFQSAQGASIDAFGGGTGQALQQAARAGGTLDQLDSMVLRQIAEDNEREAKNLDIQLQSRLRVLLHGDGSANNPGFLGLQGENALKSREAFQQEVEKARNEVLGRASPQVRQLVDPVAAARVEGVFEKSSQHTRTQREVAFQETTKARVAEAYQEAALNWNDPAKLMESIGVVTDEMIAEGERLGRSEEATQTLIEGHRSKIFQGAIEAAIPVDPMTAQTLLIKYAPLMDGDVQAEVAGKLRPYVVLQVAQDAAQEAVQKFGYGNRAAAEKWLREKFSGDQEEKAVDVMNSIFAGYRSDQSERRAQVSHSMAVKNFNQAQEDRAKDQAVDAAMAEIAASDMTREKATEQIKNAPEELRERLTVRVDNFFTNREQNERALEIKKGEQAGADAARQGKPITPYVSQSSVSPEAAEAAIQKYNVISNADEKQRKDRIEGHYRDAGRAIQAGLTFKEFMDESVDRRSEMGSQPERFAALEKTWANAEEGKLYADSSDGQTFEGLRNTSAKQLAQTELILLRDKLTEQEYKKAQTLQDGARKKMEAIGSEQAIFETAEAKLREIAPADVRRNWEQKDETPEQARHRQAFQHELDSRIAAKLEQGEKPTDEEIRRWAAEIVTPIYANPSGAFNSSGDTFAVYRNRLTPEQKKVVRVPIDTMPQTLRVSVETLLLKKGKRTDDEGVLENLAGAALMQDKERIARILNEAE